MVFSKEAIDTFGIDPFVESKRLLSLPPEKRQITFQQNLEAYREEAIEDNPVSLVYHYWIGLDGNVYTDPSCLRIFDLNLQIDTRERGNLVRKGVYKAIEMSAVRQYECVCLYSPAGKKYFEKENYDTHPYGQLYIMFFDGEKINAIAVKVAKQGEGWVSKLLGDIWEIAVRKEKEEDKISILIQNPVYVGRIDNFIQRFCKDKTFLYAKKNRYFFRVCDAVRIVERAFFEESKLSRINLNSARNLFLERQFKCTEEEVFNSYVRMIYDYMIEENLESVRIASNCGGKYVTRARIEEILGIRDLFIDPFEKFISLFSNFSQETDNISEKDFLEGVCNICGKKTKILCGVCKNCAKKAS